MGKRKLSTFERLRNGKLQWNRKQRREVERRGQPNPPETEKDNCRPNAPTPNPTQSPSSHHGRA